MGVGSPLSSQQEDTAAGSLHATGRDRLRLYGAERTIPRAPEGTLMSSKTQVDSRIHSPISPELDFFQDARVPQAVVNRNIVYSQEGQRKPRPGRKASHHAQSSKNSDLGTIYQTRHHEASEAANNPGLEATAGNQSLGTLRATQRDQQADSQALPLAVGRPRQHNALHIRAISHEARRRHAKAGQRMAETVCSLDSGQYDFTTLSLAPDQLARGPGETKTDMQSHCLMKLNSVHKDRPVVISYPYDQSHTIYSKKCFFGASRLNSRNGTRDGPLTQPSKNLALQPFLKATACERKAQWLQSAKASVGPLQPQAILVGSMALQSRVSDAAKLKEPTQVSQDN